MDKAAFMAEWKMLLLWGILLDAAAYFISTFFYGFTLRFALGLLIGTAVMLINLRILQFGLTLVLSEAKRTGKANMKLHNKYYVIRQLVFCIGFGLALFFSDAVSPIAAAIPVCYPKLIYTAQGIFCKSKIQQ